MRKPARMKLNPVTYFPPATQQQFRVNRELIRGKPYERYFNGALGIRDEVMPALRAPMDLADALQFSDINQLLEPGYRSVETGYCELPDGSAYTASLVPMPGCTAAMYSWWFWWHAVESARYTLWYPYNHIAVKPSSPGVLTKPGLTDQQRYVGTTHHVDEYIGPELLRVAIRFVDPSELGLDTSRFAQAGIVGHACARVGLRGTGVEGVSMVHLVRQVDGGLEQRSHYWIGHDPRLRTPFGEVSLEKLSQLTGGKRKLGGARVAYEQLLHDQIEFTHLASFLPALHQEFAGK
jgi:hypothetical protein